MCHWREVLRKILLVEDEELLRTSYEMIISTEPYDLDVAENGKQALEKCSNKEYDLILLDLMMPIMDGVGFLKRFKNRNTRIVVLSNLSYGHELEEAMKLGAHLNVVKSTLSPRDLLAVVRYEVTSLAV
jgi:DNA-binding response OmpR family regulator